MQGYSTPSLLYDEGFFGRSELNFNDNGPGGETTISTGLLGLSDSLDRLDTASSFSTGSLQQVIGDSSAPAPTDDINELPGRSHQNISGDHNHHHTHHHGDHHNSFGLDDNGNLVIQDMLHHHQIMTANAAGNTNDSHAHGSIIDHMNMGGVNERSAHGVEQSNGVTSQWEESLQDLQSLLALHGQQQSQNMNVGLPLTPEHGPAFANSSSSSMRASGGYGFEKGHAGSSTAGFPNSKFSSASAADSELLSMLQFPRSNTSSLQQQQQTLQAPAGPVSAFPSNPGFRKGSGGPVNSACNMQIPSAAGMYSSSSGPAQNSSSFPYTAPSLVGSNYFNVNPGGVANLNNFMNLANGPIMQKQQLMRSTSIIDLDQARDHCSEDNMAPGHGAATSSAAAAKFSSSLFQSAKRGGSEGSLLLSGKAGSEPRGINHFATERQRREYLNEKYQTLRSLVPNPSKADRASIVADAIEYVKELKRTVQELQILVQEKRSEASLKEAAAQYCSGHKRRRDMDDSNADSVGGVTEISSSLSRSFSLNNGKNSPVDPLSDASQLRSSWLQRTSQSTGTHVDVRIVHDEVTIKLTQRRRNHGRQLLLHVMATLYDLQLDLQQASGANIGEHDVYIFNTKILEGSSTFAGYVVTKLLEAVDRE